MKEKIYLFLFVILNGIILFPKFVNAECNEQQINDLNKLIDNINVKYTHNKDNYFTITLYNVPENITGTSSVGMFNDVNSENPHNSVSGFIGGYNYQIFYIANSKNKCGLSLLKTVELKLPVFNVHSKKEICKNKKYSEFEYCNEVLDKEISEDDFNKELEKYKSNNNENLKNENNESLFSKIKNMILDNLIIISISSGIIVLSSIGFIIYKKSKNKF